MISRGSSRRYYDVVANDWRELYKQKGSAWDFNSTGDGTGAGWSLNEDTDACTVDSNGYLRCYDVYNVADGAKTLQKTFAIDRPLHAVDFFGINVKLDGTGSAAFGADTYMDFYFADVTSGHYIGVRHKNEAGTQKSWVIAWHPVGTSQSAKYSANFRGVNSHSLGYFAPDECGHYTDLSGGTWQNRGHFDRTWFNGSDYEVYVKVQFHCRTSGSMDFDVTEFGLVGPWVM